MFGDTVSLPEVRVSLLPKAIIVVTAGPPDVSLLGATTIAWQGIVSSRPPVVAVSFLPDSYCRLRLEEYREFVVNVPSREMLPQVEALGAKSGPMSAKLDPAALVDSLLPSTTIRSPRLRGYYLHLECQLLQAVTLGLYDCFLGEVVAMHARSDVFLGNHPRGNVNHGLVQPITCFGDEYWAGGDYLGTSHENKDHPHGSQH